MSPFKLRFLLACLAATAATQAFLSLTGLQPQTVQAQSGAAAPPIVFVSRAIPNNGTVYWSVPKDMPGVGAHSRFRVAPPGRLLVRESNGSLRTLIDGANPTAASLRLIDVNAPDVSYDGRRILFAGFPADEFDPNTDTRALQDPDNWRIYVINADGSGLRQLTASDQDHLNYSQFGHTASGALRGYDDTDPAWLPDGRIVFSSTRWPAFAQYSAARTSNLYVMNGDGSSLHRITAERSGADRPVVDPLTGKIIFSRWWRNHRFATNQMDTVRDNEYPCCEGYLRKDGLTRDRANQLGGPDALFRNLWHLASINPDGTGLAQFTGPNHGSDGVHAYGGAFGPNDEFIANYFPMTNMSEAAGFGGLRRYRRGATEYESIIGVTARYGPNGEDVVNASNPRSFGIIKGNYAGEPAVLPDGRIVISWANDVNQDYGLYVIDRNGGNRTLLYDRPGTTELRAKLLQPRPVPPIVADSVNPNASLLPPLQNGPYDTDGTFVFDALNVYGNGPVDTVEASAPAVGSAAKIRFFTDFQRVNWGSLEMLDWPILLTEKTVAKDGSVRHDAPANIQLFEQIRSADGTVPFTLGGPFGATHVAGMNYGKPGQVARCIGCHAGHTMIPVPANPEDAKWSNLAPGAQIRASSSRNVPWNKGLVDRRANKGPIWYTWASAQGNVANQWVELVFPEPVTVRTVRLYNVRFTDGSSLQVNKATVRLGASGSSQWLASASAQNVATTGTDVAFPDVKAQTVRVEFDSASGFTSDRLQVVALSEIEVIARAGDGVSSPPPANTAPTLTILSPTPGATVSQGTPVALSATATDTQDGDLSSKIAWTSNLDGPLGAGATLSKALRTGAHVITATVADKAGLTAAKTVAITVNAPSPNTAPTLTILSPAPGASVPQGTPVALAAKATDTQDGDLSSKIAWTSNLDGPLGAGATLSKTLRAGAHVITATVADKAGLTAAKTVAINVNAPSANTAPTLTILSPAPGASVPQGTPVALAAKATDTQDGDLSGKIAWTSNLDGPLGAGATLSKTLRAGAHVITATVADKGGLTAAKSVSLTISAAPAQASLAVSSVAPNPIQPDRWTRITISGKGFTAGAGLSLRNGDGYAPVIWRPTVVNAGTMVAFVRAPGAGGRIDRFWDVVVTNPDGKSAVLAKGLTVLSR